MAGIRSRGGSPQMKDALASRLKTYEQNSVSDQLWKEVPGSIANNLVDESRSNFRKPRRSESSLKPLCHLSILQHALQWPCCKSVSRTQLINHRPAIPAAGVFLLGPCWCPAHDRRCATRRKVLVKHGTIPVSTHTLVLQKGPSSF